MLKSYTFKCPNCGSTKLMQVEVIYHAKAIQPEIQLDQLREDSNMVRVLVKDTQEEVELPNRVLYGCSTCGTTATLNELISSGALTETYAESGQED